MAPAGNQVPNNEEIYEEDDPGLLNNEEAPPVIYEDPERMFRARNRANREAVRQDQGVRGAQQRADLRAPVQQQAPIQQQIRRPPRQPVFYEEYDEEDYDQEPTMGELSAPDFHNQSWCIYEGPDLEAIAINTAIVHHLPKFSGTRGESATSHLQRYHEICQNLKPHGVEVDDFKLKAFYFSLIDSATDWFLSLP
ncbi:unnamed protein product [Rhodiola kirilowii]